MREHCKNDFSTMPSEKMSDLEQSVRQQLGKYKSGVIKKQFHLLMNPEQ